MNVEQFNDYIRKIKYDQKSFDIIYKKYFPLIVSHIRRKFYGQDIDADDVAQETFLKLYCADIKENIEKPVPWLYVISDRIAFTMLGKMPPTVELYEDANLSDFINLYFEMDDLADRLDKMESDSHMIVYLHLLEGYKLKEISDMLNMNYNTVRQKFRRAKNYLKTIKK